MYDIIINYVEGEGPVPLAPNATIDDKDNTTLVRLVARLLNLYDQPLEVLSVFGDHPNIIVSYDNMTGILDLSGVAPIADYVQLLRNLSYDNLNYDPGDPNTTMRVVEVEVFDGVNSRVEGDAFITFHSVNDPPFFDLNGPGNGTNFTTVFVEDGPAIWVTSPYMTLFDVDNSTLAYVKVSIVNPMDPGEQLIPHFTNNTTLYPNGSLLVYGLATTMDFRNYMAGIKYIDPAYVLKNNETRPSVP